MIKDIEPDRDDPTYCAKCDKNHSIHYDCTFGAAIIWNAAIEAAASIVDECNREGPYQAIAAAKRIRKLKK